MIASWFNRTVFGPRTYLKKRDLKKMTRRHPFSAFLNYVAYDPSTQLYYNQDNTIGMLWECSPVIYAGPKTITALEGLFRAGMPKGSILQLIFQADSHIEPILRKYKRDRLRNRALLHSRRFQLRIAVLQSRTKRLACCQPVSTLPLTAHSKSWRSMSQM